MARVVRQPPSIAEIGPATRELILGTSTCPLLTPTGIILTGISDARAGFRFARPDPTITQVLATVSGEGEALVDGTWRRATPGQAYITPPHQSHGYRALPRGVWRVAWVIYRADALTLHDPPLLKTVDALQLEAAVLGLHRELSTIAEPAAVASWVCLLDTCARRALAADVLDARLGELWQAVGANLSKPWTLPEMARMAGLSAEHLRRLCQAAVHRSPMQHVTHLRMRHALELLKATDRRVDEIAWQVGYRNPLAFSTAFRRQVGMAPSACRRTRAH